MLGHKLRCAKNILCFFILQKPLWNLAIVILRVKPRWLSWWWVGTSSFWTWAYLVSFGNITLALFAETLLTAFFLGSWPLIRMLPRCIRMLPGSQADPHCARLFVLHLSLPAAQVFVGSSSTGKSSSPFPSLSSCLCHWTHFIPLLFSQPPRLFVFIEKQPGVLVSDFCFLLGHIPDLCSDAQIACRNGPKRKRGNQRQ